MPPLTALLADSTGQICGDLGPLAWTRLPHVFTDDAIFLFRPLAFLSSGVVGARISTFRSRNCRFVDRRPATKVNPIHDTFSIRRRGAL